MCAVDEVCWCPRDVVWMCVCGTVVGMVVCACVFL